jgi:hypothetical protein
VVPAFTWNVDVVIVDGFMSWLNVAVIDVEGEIEVPPFAGAVEATVGTDVGVGVGVVVGPVAGVSVNIALSTYIAEFTGLELNMIYTMP